MAGLQEGKISCKTIYLDFDNVAEHHGFSNTELDTVQQYYIKLVAQTSAYCYYNHYIMQELVHDNEPLQLAVTYDWDVSGHPQFIFLDSFSCGT